MRVCTATAPLPVRPYPAGSGNIAAGQQSDHLLIVAAVSGWLALGADSLKPQSQQVHLRAYLKKFFLHEQTLKELQVRGRPWPGRASVPHPSPCLVALLPGNYTLPTGGRHTSLRATAMWLPRMWGHAGRGAELAYLCVCVCECACAHVCACVYVCVCAHSASLPTATLASAAYAPPLIALLLAHCARCSCSGLHAFPPLSSLP